MSCLQKSLCWDTIAGAGFGAIWIVPATWMPSGLAAVIKFGIRWSRWSVWILWEHLVLGFSKSRLCRYIGSPKLGPLLLSAVIVPGENEFIQMAIELELMGWARHQKVQCGLKPVDLNLIYTSFTPFWPFWLSCGCDYVTSLCYKKCWFLRFGSPVDMKPLTVNPEFGIPILPSHAETVQNGQVMVLEITSLTRCNQSLSKSELWELKGPFFWEFAHSSCLNSPQAWTYHDLDDSLAQRDMCNICVIITRSQTWQRGTEVLAMFGRHIHHVPTKTSFWNHSFASVTYRSPTSQRSHNVVMT